MLTVVRPAQLWSFQEKIISPNGEDFLYVFYATIRGLYILMSYNIIEQEVKTPIICNGFRVLQNGELCYFKTENEQTNRNTGGCCGIRAVFGSANA